MTELWLERSITKRKTGKRLKQQHSRTKRLKPIGNHLQRIDEGLGAAGRPIPPERTENGRFAHQFRNQRSGVTPATDGAQINTPQKTFGFREHDEFSQNPTKNPWKEQLNQKNPIWRGPPATLKNYNEWTKQYPALYDRIQKESTGIGIFRVRIDPETSSKNIRFTRQVRIQQWYSMIDTSPRIPRCSLTLAALQHEKHVVSFTVKDLTWWAYQPPGPLWLIVVYFEWSCGGMDDHCRETSLKRNQTLKISRYFPRFMWRGPYLLLAGRFETKWWYCYYYCC